MMVQKKKIENQTKRENKKWKEKNETQQNPESIPNGIRKIEEDGWNITGKSGAS